MPTPTKYTYSVSSDTASAKVNLASLKTEIEASVIVVALDYINNSGDVLDIWFKDALSTSSPDDVANLLAVVNAHTGALPAFVVVPRTTEDSAEIIAVNNIPAGYTLYPTGEADDITNGTYGGGNVLHLKQGGTTQIDFQSKTHWHLLGGKAKWYGGSNADDYAHAALIAPATTGLTNVTGDYDKIDLGGGANLIKPVAAGTGAWSMDLTATLNANVSILKATPVPVAGNTGWYDYNSTTNVLTRNMSQTGGYNLYDFDANLFKFGRRLFGGDGLDSYEYPTLRGKLLYSNWILRFNLSATNTGIGVGIILSLGSKANI